VEKLRDWGRRTFASLKTRNYRLYFIGQAISLCGTWMQSIGQAWLVLNLTKSGTALGVVVALQTLPILLFGPLGGVSADRFPKRRILYFTQSASAVLALTLGTLVATGSIRLWMVYVLALGLGLVNTVDNPTRQTFIVEMVGRQSLTNAVSLNSSAINLARVLGPSIGGVLIAHFGIAPCFLFNGVSFLAVIAVLTRMRADELLPAAVSGRSRGQLTAGFRYVRSEPLLRSTLLMMAIIGTLTYEFQVVLPLFASFTFHGNAGSYAALTAAMGAGAVIGGLITASRERTSPEMLVRAAFLFGVVVLVTALMPSLHTAMLALVFVGIFSILFTSLGNVTLQLNSLPEMRGRVMALWTVAFLGSTPIGGPIIGWIGEHIGPRGGLAVGGIAAIAAAAIGAWQFSRLPKPTSDTGSAEPRFAITPPVTASNPAKGHV